MILWDMHAIGERLYAIRRRMGLTQAATAEKAGLTVRTYVDVERGTVNMRVETILHICEALQITPDEILTEKDGEPSADEEALLARLRCCTPKQRETAWKLVSVYLQSLE